MQGRYDLTAGQVLKIAVGQADMSAVVTEVKSSGADAVFYGGYYAEAAKLSTQLRDAGVEAQLVFGDGVKDQGGYAISHRWI